MHLRRHHAQFIDHLIEFQPDHADFVMRLHDNRLPEVAAGDNADNIY